MNPRQVLRAFFFPRPSLRYAQRIVLTAFLAAGFFRYFCRPMRIQGVSMEPSFADGSYRFYWRHAFRRRLPRRGEVVAVRLAGEQVMLLKRVVALEGEIVAFENGQLMIDGRPLEEPWETRPGTWNLPPRRVDPGHVYVVGDNRSTPMHQHQFGQVALERLAGKPLW